MSNQKKRGNTKQVTHCKHHTRKCVADAGRTHGNKDLWKEVDELRKGRRIEVVKIESHLDENPERRAGYKRSDILRNVVADAYADGVVDEARLTHRERQPSSG